MLLTQIPVQHSGCNTHVHRLEYPCKAIDHVVSRNTMHDWSVTRVRNCVTVLLEENVALRTQTLVLPNRIVLPSNICESRISIGYIQFVTTSAYAVGSWISWSSTVKLTADIPPLHQVLDPYAARLITLFVFVLKFCKGYNNKTWITRFFFPLKPSLHTLFYS